MADPVVLRRPSARPYVGIGAAAQAYLDGELCGVRPDGTTSFSMIQAASDAGNVDALVYFLFDLLYLDGEAIGPADARHLVDRRGRANAQERFRTTKS